jgi:Cu/Ag efflux pump CusA
MIDWLYDALRGANVSRAELVEMMVEDQRSIVRVSDMDALVAHAAKTFDINDEAAWETGDTDVMLAISNWRKERVDWVRP